MSKPSFNLQNIYLGKILWNCSELPVIPQSDSETSVPQVLLYQNHVYQWSLECMKYSQVLIPECENFFFMDIEACTVVRVQNCSLERMLSMEGSFLEPIRSEIVTFHENYVFSTTPIGSSEKAYLTATTRTKKNDTGLFFEKSLTPPSSPILLATTIRFEEFDEQIYGNGYGSTPDQLSTSNPLILYDNAEMCGICPTFRRTNTCQDVVKGKWTSVEYPSSATGEFKILKGSNYQIHVSTSFSCLNITHAQTLATVSQTIYRRRGDTYGINVVPISTEQEKSSLISSTDLASDVSISNFILIRLEKGDYISIQSIFTCNPNVAFINFGIASNLTISEA